jgi:hypothetical protein
VEEAEFELFVPLGMSASELVEPCAETKSRARTEFLRGETNSSNPSPSSGESVSPIDSEALRENKRGTRQSRTIRGLPDGP